MALRTGSTVVSARQWEGGAVVVDTGTAPATRGVAASAILAKAAVMLVLRRVTGDTGLRCAGVAVALVAPLAGSTGVSARQGKGRLSVVNAGTAPTARAVAAGAVVSGVPFGGVVAGNTAAGRQVDHLVR